jgi:hypothetical protein
MSQTLIKFYYYDDDGNHYSNRIEARLSGKHCWFYFHEDHFNSINWTKSPDSTLSQLYKERAQQLRDSYDRIVICYSGGIDSTNVLETFYHNRIHIDEIFITGAFSQDQFKDSDQLHNACLYLNAFPALAKMSLPNTKISVVDHSDLIRDPQKLTLIRDYGIDYYKHIGSRPSIHNLIWHDLDLILEDRRHTAYVLGKDKPFLRYDTELGRYYTHFGDVGIVDYGNRYDYSNGDRINFYTAPEATDMMLKQLHAVMDWHCENVLINSKLSNDQFNQDYASIVKKIIYDLHEPLIFENSKSKSHYLSRRDSFILDNSNSDMFSIYMKSMRKMFDDIKTSENFTFTSKRYYLS